MKFKIVQRKNDWEFFENIRMMAEEAGVPFDIVVSRDLPQKYCSLIAAEKRLNKINSMDTSPENNDYWAEFGALGVNFHFYIDKE